MAIHVNKDNRSITADQTKCAGCIVCMLRCCFRNGKKFNLSKSYIRIERQVSREDEFSIDFTPECDACLICARYCPYGALTATKVEKGG